MRAGRIIAYDISIRRCAYGICPGYQRYLSVYGRGTRWCRYAETARRSCINYEINGATVRSSTIPCGILGRDAKIVVPIRHRFVSECCGIDGKCFNHRVAARIRCDLDIVEVCSRRSVPRDRWLSIGENSARGNERESCRGGTIDLKRYDGRVLLDVGVRNFA
jgi:hypothetical protein